MSLMHRLTCGFEELSVSVFEIQGNVKQREVCLKEVLFVRRGFLVWYNKISGTDERKLVVVPRWFLVWYNK